MKLIFQITVFVCAIFLHLSVNAQTEATVSLDTNTILVGDQINLHLTFTAPKGTEIQWPKLNDTIIAEIEILEKSKIDSSFSSDKSKITLHQILKITSFDSGYYAIPPFRFNYKKHDDQLVQYTETQAVLLSVHTIPVDTAKEIRDIKKPIAAPFTFREALPWIIGLLLLAGSIYFIMYYLKKRKKAEPVFRAPVKIKFPPHQIALDALEILRNKKLWQNGQIKDYHTELTDIIRDYVYGKFSIHAPELTSDEILTALNYTATNEQARKKLNQTFEVADLVKFAKMQPMPMEHDASLNNAIDFVKETMFLSGPVPETETIEEITNKAEDPGMSEPETMTDKTPVIQDNNGKEVKDV
jgi:hypothetical protein